ncbi:MAG: hypothetical protein LUD69_07965 [Oscillospiraceae bacterium]|nr:hypothetical protein [Oscillospiraceae bacterium]
MQEANSVGLSSDLAAKVMDGTIDIETLDEDTADLVSQFQEWYIFMPLYLELVRLFY